MYCLSQYVCCRAPTANGHITLSTPVLVRSLKLCSVEPSQYLDGWLLGNTGCRWHFFDIFLFPKMDWELHGTWLEPIPTANGHITLNTPVLVRSLKLSSVEPSQYLDGWPPGNTGCRWHFFGYFSVLKNVLGTSWPWGLAIAHSKSANHVISHFWKMDWWDGRFMRTGLCASIIQSSPKFSGLSGFSNFAVRQRKESRAIYLLSNYSDKEP